MIIRRSLILIVLFVLALIGVPLIGTQILNKWLDTDISGWVQTGIALVSFPVILYEINEIRREIGKKPELDFGLVNIRDLPFSRIRDTKQLPNTINVSQGYPLFYIVFKNTGTSPAKYLKIYIEHINRDQKIFPSPLIKVSEFSEGKHSFINEHNFDFVFRSGIDWIIVPGDIEPFGFYITTSVGSGKTYKDKFGQEQQHMVSPPVCEVILDCIVWAEGIDNPLKKQLSIKVVSD